MAGSPALSSSESMRAEKRAAAGNSVLAAVVITALKVVVGFTTGSLGILSEAAHSRRWGILLSAVSLGFVAMMAIIARTEPDAWKAAAAGLVPLAAGLGFLLDSALIRRDLKAATTTHS